MFLTIINKLIVSLTRQFGLWSAYILEGDQLLEETLHIDTIHLFEIIICNYYRYICLQWDMTICYYRNSLL